MKRVFLILFMIIAVIVVAFVITGFLKSQTVDAQQTPASRNNYKQTWEYCAIVDTYGMNGKNGNPTGYAKLCYFDESGYREDTINIQGEMTSISPNEVYEKARQRALAVTIARLGSQGWELVGQFPFTKRFGTDEKDRTGLYFKRAKPQ